MTKTHSHPVDSEEICNATLWLGENAPLVQPVAVSIKKTMDQKTQKRKKKKKECWGKEYADKELYKALWADKRKHDLALSSLQLHRLPPSKPLEIPPAHSASVTHNSVNKASSKRQERYAGMKDPSLMFLALRMRFRVSRGGGGGNAAL